MAFLSNLGTHFWENYVAMCRAIKANPVHMAAVWLNESGWDPNIRTNPMTPTAGLNQCTGPTLRGLGFGVGLDNQHATDAFRQLSGVDQLPWIQKYYTPYIGLLNTAVMCYVANFEPGYLQAAKKSQQAGGDYTFGTNGVNGWLGIVYRYNPGLDHNHDNQITYADLDLLLRDLCQGPRWRQIVDAICAITGESPFQYSGTYPDEVPWKTAPYIKQLQAGLNAVYSATYANAISGSHNAPGQALPLVVDGVLGKATEAVVRAFQGQQSLVVDGRPGPQTRSKLAAALKLLKAKVQSASFPTLDGTG